jgi:hypothetical protein
MSHLAEEIEKDTGKPTLTSPQIAMNALKKRVSEL